MINNTLGIVGCGFVGTAVKRFFEKKFEVKVFDIISSKRTKNVESLKDLAESRVIFLALPTPIDMVTGQCNFEIINSTLKELNDLSIKSIIVLKSSIPPGKTNEFQEQFPNLKLVFNPEFLTERNANEDFKNQTKIILGGNEKHTGEVAYVYKEVKPSLTVHETDTNTAEMVKFTINCFLATKVSFFNEMYQVCQASNINYDDMIALTLLDKRIGESHTSVPGWDGRLGFGGSCFPANINIMIHKMLDFDIKPVILKATWDKNLEVRSEKDWESLKGRCVV